MRTWKDKGIELLTQRELEAVISVLNDKIGDLEYMHDDRAMSPNVKEAMRLQICILSDARQKLSEPSNA